MKNLNRKEILKAIEDTENLLISIEVDNKYDLSKIDVKTVLKVLKQDYIQLTRCIKIIKEQIYDF